MCHHNKIMLQQSWKIFVFNCIGLLSLALLAYSAQAKQGNSQVDKGRLLFSKNNCNVCHSINANGGCLAPPLDGINKRRNLDFIMMRISEDPSLQIKFQQTFGQELMPHPRLEKTAAKCIAHYLMTIPANSEVYASTGHSEAGSKSLNNNLFSTNNDNLSLETGRKLYNESGCVACHAIGGLGGDFGPSLDNVADRLSKTKIVERIARANLLVPVYDEYSGKGAVMPPLNLNENEVQAIANFLMTLKPSSK